MTGDADSLITLLNGEDSHPDIRQTHISIVYLTSNHAYKRLKPVKFDFLDFSSREARYAHLASEARLNRRLTTGIYRRLVPVWRPNGIWKFAGTGPPDDWLLEMKRLSTEANLEFVLQNGGFSEPLLDQVITSLVAFFSKADRSAEICANGHRAVIRRNLIENHEVIHSVGESSHLNAELIRRLRSCQLQVLEKLEDELQERMAGAWVRDGHGDLRCEHIYLTTPIQIVDCIAFNHRLRWIDVADDIAFLATDFVRLEAEDWAKLVIDRYRSLMADPVSDQLLSFYRSYRFAVRAKVSLLRWQECRKSDERESASLQARQFVEYATSELSWNRPWLIVVCGLSGTGKTTLGRVLSERIGAIQISSDRIRKDLAGLAPTDRGNEMLYSEDMHKRTYAELHSQAAKLLRSGTGAVLDATYLKRADRESIRATATQFGTVPLFLECRCNETEIVRRLRQRHLKNDDASDATVDVWRSQRTISDCYTELDRFDHMIVDTSQSSDRLLDEIVSRMKDR